MTKRFRMIAGPNGSGKSTLADLLRRDYAVNFYTMLNADDIFAEVSRTHAYLQALPVDGESLKCYVRQSEYAPQTKDCFDASFGQSYTPAGNSVSSILQFYSAFMQMMQQYKKSPNNVIRNTIMARFGNTYYFEYFFLRNITYY